MTRRPSRHLESAGWSVRDLYEPVIRPLLARLAGTERLRLLIDSSTVSFHHQLLSVS